MLGPPKIDGPNIDYSYNLFSNHVQYMMIFNVWNHLSKTTFANFGDTHVLEDTQHLRVCIPRPKSKDDFQDNSNNTRTLPDRFKREVHTSPTLISNSRQICHVYITILANSQTSNWWRILCEIYSMERKYLGAKYLVF